MYKGATPPLLGWALMDSVHMGARMNILMALKDVDKSPSLLDHCLAGMGAGLVLSFVATPIEVVKARLQIQYSEKTSLYKGPIDCVRKLYGENGIRGLYKGLDGCLLFRGQFWVLWGSYEIYTKAMLQYGMSPSMVPFFAGGLAANTFWTFSFPAGQ